MVNLLMKSIAFLCLSMAYIAEAEESYQCMRQSNTANKESVSQLGWPELTIFDPQDQNFHLKDLDIKKVANKSPSSSLS